MMNEEVSRLLPGIHRSSFIIHHFGFSLLSSEALVVPRQDFSQQLPAYRPRRGHSRHSFSHSSGLPDDDSHMLL
jgi:hypothetical protein